MRSRWTDARQPPRTPRHYPPMPHANTEFCVPILGGYGQFGARIAAALARDKAMNLVIAGRQHDAGERRVETLRHVGANASLSACSIDIDAMDFTAQLVAMALQRVIHTAGPFQNRDYRVAESALAAGAHYVDLAYACDHASGVGLLADQARRAGRWVVAGPSSVPGLSAAVVEAHASRFGALESIEVAICPGSSDAHDRAARGSAPTRCTAHTRHQPQ